jgi:tryptophan synthase beta subunit
MSQGREAIYLGLGAGAEAVQRPACFGVEAHALRQAMNGAVDGSAVSGALSPFLIGSVAGPAPHDRLMQHSQVRA